MARKLVIATVAFAMLAFPMTTPLASADGMTHVYDDVYDDWSLSAEETQYGMINLVGGSERLLLAIRVDSDTLASADQAVWIFTVPGDPDQIEVDLMPAVREISGEPFSHTARREFCENLVMGYGTQLYPVAALLLTPSVSPSLLLGDDSKDYGPGVEVSTHIESRGMTMEVVSAQYADALEAYLLGLGLELDEGSASLIGEYVGDEYAFVVSWISDVEQFSLDVPMQYDRSTGEFYYELGLFAEFPTDRVFYPLRLTSVYGERVVPMLLQVLGFVQTDAGAADYGPLDIAVEHKVSRYYSISPELSPFFTADGNSTVDEYMFLQNFRYTEVVIKAPSELLEADLWMVPASSTSLDVQLWVTENGFLASLMVVLGLSSLAGVVSGALVFAPHRPVLWKFAVLGLANVLTVVGLWFAARTLEVERTMTRPEVPVPASPYRADFLFVYSFVFLASVTMVLMAFWA
ncbi:MAG: hypothetical protein AB1793_04760 [Candidatus Thermoplasmatota archaeon]